MSEEESFQEAFDLIMSVFKVDSLYEEQEALIKAFCQGKNIFLSAGTGYGKSLVFQSIPWCYDIINEQAIGTATLLVVCPLLALMEDQVSKMKETGISAVSIHQDTPSTLL